MAPLIIAHRGESYDAPENTLASINLAWERNASAVEIDVHRTLDNEIAVIHDTTTKRVGDTNLSVKNSPIASLKNVDVGSWKSTKFAGEKIPTLNEVFDTVPNGKKIIIEIKSNKTIIPFIVEQIHNSKLKYEQIEIISFNFKIVSEIKRQLPSYRVLYLADLDYTWFTNILSPNAEKLIKMAKSANLDGLNVWAGKILDEPFIKKVKSSGLLIYCWTVNDIKHAKRLLGYGIDGITTDRAEWMLSNLY